MGSKSFQVHECGKNICPVLGIDRRSVGQQHCEPS